MSGKFFSIKERHLICAGCAELIRTEVEAATVLCPACGRQHSLPPRSVGDPFRGTPSPRPAFSGTEEERRARLLAQDGLPIATPSGLESYAGGVTPETAAGAWAEWQRARVALLEGGGDPYRLGWLTRVLRNFLIRQDDLARERAMLETAQDVLPNPDRQGFRCMLARSAAKEGDFASARAWLALCDARSDDLVADSSYRVTRAYLETRQGGDPRAILEVLGRSPAEVPIDETNDNLAVAFRVNALERNAEVEAAVEQLTEALRSGRQLGRIIETNADVGLCRESYPLALERVAGKDPRSDAARGRGLARAGLTIFYWVGLAELVAAAACFCLIPVGGAIGASTQVLVMVGATLALMSGPLFFIGRRARRGAKQLTRILVEGIPGVAHVLGATPTGTKVSGQPELLIVANLTAPGRTAARAEAREVIPGDVEIRAGTQLPVRFLPDDPGQFAVEWERLAQDGSIRPAEERAPGAPVRRPRIGRFRVTMLIGVLGPVIMLFGLGQCPTMCGFGEVALKKMNQCPRAVELLGAPIKSTFGLSLGSFRSGSGGGRASWMMPVSGPKGRGSCKVVMRSEGSSDWQLLEGYLSVGSTEVDIAQCALAGAGQAVSARRELPGTVVETAGSPPVGKQSACTVTIEPGGGPFGCRISVRCEGKLLYGGEKLGYVKCTVQPRAGGGPPTVTALDDEDTAASGDPVLDLSERRNELLLSDKIEGRSWSLTIKLASK